MSEVDIAIAFAAGVISFFSPCSVSVLPAFIAYYLGRREDDAPIVTRLFGSHRLFAYGLVLSLTGGAFAVGALAHNFVDLDRNRIFDVAVGLVGLGVLLVGLALLASSSKALEPSTRNAYREGATRGVTGGLIATAGFVVVYGGIGILVAATISGLGASGATSSLASILPWVSLVTAFGIIALGTLLAVGRSPFTYIPALRAPGARKALSFLMFGVAYAVISTSCLLPVFLSVLARALSLSPTESVVVFLSMAAGSGLLMIITATYVALAKQTTVGYIKRFQRYVNPVAGALVVLFASYTVYYDLVTFFGFG